MSKFELNPMVKESGKSILLKLHIIEINVVAQRPPTLPEY